jgi:hypothetical protein
MVPVAMAMQQHGGRTKAGELVDADGREVRPVSVRSETGDHHPPDAGQRLPYAFPPER